MAKRKNFSVEFVGAPHNPIRKGSGRIGIEELSRCWDARCSARAVKRALDGKSQPASSYGPGAHPADQYFSDNFVERILSEYPALVLENVKLRMENETLLSVARVAPGEASKAE